MDDHVTRILTELRQYLEALYGERLRNIVLFGSEARGDAGPYSDIDVLIVLQGSPDPNEEDRRISDYLYDIWLKHERLVFCIFMGEDRYLHRQGPLLRNIRREGIPV
jgi:uncharacterized protein